MKAKILRYEMRIYLLSGRNPKVIIIIIIFFYKQWKIIFMARYTEEYIMNTFIWIFDKFDADERIADVIWKKSVLSI